MKRRKSPGLVAALLEAGCGLQLIGMAIYLTIGFMATRYDVWMIFGKDVPWIGAIVGAFFGGITVPVAVIVWILNLAHVVFPLVK